MKQEYKSPTVEVLEFENKDVICTSGAIDTPAQSSLFREGTDLGNTSMIDLFK